MKDSLKKFMEEKMLPWGMKIGGESIWLPSVMDLSPRCL